MGVGQLSESDAVDALRLPFYSSSHPTGSHGWRNQFDLGNPDWIVFARAVKVGETAVRTLLASAQPLEFRPLTALLGAWRGPRPLAAFSMDAATRACGATAG